jgi:hypothetical protein
LVSTLVSGLAEPSGVVALGNELLVVESASHRISRVRLPEEATMVRAPDMLSQRPTLTVRPGPVALDVEFKPPPGQKLDDRYGPAVHMVVSATPADLLAEGEGAGSDLRRLLLVGDAVTSGILHVSARVASCDDSDAEFPACHIHQQDWGVPVEVNAEGTAEVFLPLAAR